MKTYAIISIWNRILVLKIDRVEEERFQSVKLKLRSAILLL